MPNGIFSGFAFDNNLFENIDESLIAVIGYPHRDEGSTKPYREIYLMMQPVDGNAVYRELNRAEILDFLRNNKTAARHVPQWIDCGDSDKLTRLSEIMRNWMENQVPKQATTNVLNILKSSKATRRVIPTPKTDNLLEEKFKLENFDLIVWDYVTVSK